MKKFIIATLFSAHLVAASVCFAIEPVTKSSSGSLSAGGNSFRPVISADGSRVVFVSHANNLVTNDNGREWLDIFLGDTLTSNTVLISVTTAGAGGGNGNSFAASISSNGLFVAFASEAGDLIDGDTNEESDIFVRDVAANVTRLVSADMAGNPLVHPNPFSRGPLASINPMISADGRWVFFESRATNLTMLPDPTPILGFHSVDVFARDLQSNITTHVSRSALSAQAANASSELMSITPDGYRCVSAALNENGRYVAFIVVPTNDIPAASRSLAIPGTSRPMTRKAFSRFIFARWRAEPLA